MQPHVDWPRYTQRGAMMVSRHRFELYREMKIISEARKVIIKAGWLVCWLLQCQTSQILSRPVRSLHNELGKRFLHVAEVLLLEIHMIVLGLVHRNLGCLAVNFGCDHGKHLTMRFGPIFLISSSTVQLSVHVPMSRSPMTKGLPLAVRRLNSPAFSILTRRISSGAAVLAVDTLESSGPNSWSSRSSSISSLSAIHC